MIDYIMVLIFMAVAMLFMGASFWILSKQKISDKVLLYVYYLVSLIIVITIYCFQYFLIERFEPEALEKCATYGKILGRPTKYVLIQGCVIK